MTFKELVKMWVTTINGQKAVLKGMLEMQNIEMSEKEIIKAIAYMQLENIFEHKKDKKKTAYEQMNEEQRKFCDYLCEVVLSGEVKGEDQ